MEETVDTTQQKNYGADSIQVLEGLEAVRKRPGMYIGSTDARGMHHLVWEIVDNAIDEAIAGFGKKIILKITEDGGIRVQDFGRGIPTGKHKSGVPTPQVVYTVLHAGGKFNDSTYTTSVGLHGVGASVVTALSKILTVTISRDGKIHRQTFEDGGTKISKLEVIGESKLNGTEVYFKANPATFGKATFNKAIILERLQENAFLLKGVEMVVIDERDNTSFSFMYENGLNSYVEFINENKSPIGNIIFFNGKENEIEVEVAMQYTQDSYDETVISYANNIKTGDGGTHETGFRTAFTRCLNDFAKKYNYIKEKNN
jgi:topoisomerase-4 subunit B